MIILQSGPVAAGVSVASTTTSPELEVSHQARSLQPGEVVLLTVRSGVPLHNVSARVFGAAFPLFADGSPALWRGLVGIDLDVAPGLYPVEICATSLGREECQAGYNLDVRGKRFATRRLTVNEAFVNPPAEALQRIRKEQEEVNAILGVVSPDPLWSGQFLRPVPGADTSSFGKRSIINGQPRSPHSGVDFSAREGTPVKAPNGGTVVLVSDLYFSGKTVILDHGLGLYSYFAHLSGAAAAVGDRVARGDLIGYVGSTGRVTAPHLHWALRLNGTRVDPLSLIWVQAPPKRAQ